MSSVKNRDDDVYSRTQDQPDWDPKGTKRQTRGGSIPRTTTARGDAQDKLPVTGVATKVKAATDAAYKTIARIKDGGDDEHDF